MKYIILAIVSYLLGSVLFGEIVAYALTGESASHLGTSGNPGMANVMGNLGLVPGLIVLIGDAGKCIVAGLIGYKLAGASGLLWAGLFATLGHDFPFWRHFHGGKGVATTCMLIFMYGRWWGLAALIIGLLIVIVSKYLCVGGVAIPLLMVPYAFDHGTFSGIIMVILTLLQLYEHSPQLRLIPSGQADRTDLIAGLRHKHSR